MTFKLESLHLTAAMCEVGTGLVSTLVSTPRQKKEKTTKEMALKFAKELLATSTVNVT